MLREGRVQFVLSIPEDFSRRLLRGERPAVLVEADATDPAATGPAVSAVEVLVRTVLNRDLQGIGDDLLPKEGAISLVLHRLYNPEIITQYNIVPGLLGVVLTMTMVMISVEIPI